MRFFAAYYARNLLEEMENRDVNFHALTVSSVPQFLLLSATFPFGLLTRLILPATTSMEMMT
jgi:hypothetical protein